MDAISISSRFCSPGKLQFFLKEHQNNTTVTACFDFSCPEKILSQRSSRTWPNPLIQCDSYCLIPSFFLLLPLVISAQVIQSQASSGHNCSISAFTWMDEWMDGKKKHSRKKNKRPRCQTSNIQTPFPIKP